MQAGDILGHEFCGIIDEVGPQVTGLTKGQRVVASFQIACGECRMCQKGLSSACDLTNGSSLQNIMFGSRTAGLFGYSHFTGGFAGGQAEYVRVPYGSVNLLPLPDDVPDEKGAYSILIVACISYSKFRPTGLYLSDVLATSYHCVVDTGVKSGDNVAIWGAGPIGLMAAVFAFQKGASRVIIVDANWRLKYVKSKLPKIETLDYSALPRGKTVTAAIHELVPGGVDVSLECVAGEYAKGWAHYFEMALGLETDTSEILNEMITSTRKYGSCGVTGAYVGCKSSLPILGVHFTDSPIDAVTNHFNIGSLMERGIRFIGNGQAPVQKYWKELLAQIQSGELDPLVMVSHRIPLEDVAVGYKKFDERKEEEGIMKVFVQTKFSAPPAPGAPPLTRLQ